MKIALFTNSLSPHQLPLASRIVKAVGDKSFRYIHTSEENRWRGAFGSDDREALNIKRWVLQYHAVADDSVIQQATEWLASADILISGVRDYKLMAERAQQGLLTIYMSERWFKPPFGMWQLLDPRYFKMAYGFAKMLKQQQITYLPTGVHAATDMARLCSFFSGNLLSLWRVPKVKFEPFPMGSIIADRTKDCYALSQMCVWGYFVAPRLELVGDNKPKIETQCSSIEGIKILWCGRMVKLKRVDTIIKAVTELLAEGKKIRLKLVGEGPELTKLKRMTRHWLSRDAITFEASVSLAQVREYMCEADIYVLASNDYEGWGAVVNEAMEAGCCVIGTHQAGASATMIQHGENGYLFDAGDYKRLKSHIEMLLENPNERARVASKSRMTIANYWGVDRATQKLMDYLLTKEQ